METPLDDVGGYEFYINNRSFEAGDAEYWYSVIRWARPKKIIEIGCGFSSRMARRAIAANRESDSSYDCNHLLIEPYENEWLEELGSDVQVIRKKVEECGFGVFQELEANDILFIDSSHVIRPKGDVLYEYLEILPRLKAGVIVHIHDMFTPRDYPAAWLIDEVRLWNEQYLVEAFLTSNEDWKIIGALNYLRHNYFFELHEKCPFLAENSQPGSFYIQKTR